MVITALGATNGHPKLENNVTIGLHLIKSKMPWPKEELKWATTVFLKELKETKSLVNHQLENNGLLVEKAEVKNPNLVDLMQIVTLIKVPLPTQKKKKLLMMVITGEKERKRRKKLNLMKMIATKKKEVNKNGYYSKKINNHQLNSLKAAARKRKRSKKQNQKSQR